MTRALNSTQWIVGPEYNENLFVALAQTMGELGYRLGEHAWGVGGSQQVSSWTVEGPRGVLCVEAETYVGLSVSGPEALVGEVRQAFFAQNAPHGAE